MVDFYSHCHWDTGSLIPLDPERLKCVCSGGFLTGVDLESFEVISDSYAKDKNHVFYQLLVVEEADPDTFVVTADYYGRDKDNAFYEDQVIEGEDGL